MKTNISNTEYKNISELYSRMSSPEIAKIYHTHPQTIRKILERMSIKRRNRQQAYLLAFSKGRIKKQIVKIPKEGWKIAYLAGLIDGEGHIGISKGRPQISVYNTNEEVMKWIVRNFHGSMYRNRYYQKNIERKKMIFYWSVASTTEAYKLLNATIPFLIIKRKEAMNLIQHLETRISKYSIRNETSYDSLVGVGKVWKASTHGGHVIYVPTDLTKDSAYPFKVREEVVVVIEPEKMRLTITKRG